MKTSVIPCAAKLVLVICIFCTVIARGQSRNELLETIIMPNPSLVGVDSMFVDVHATNWHYLLGISVEESIALTEKIRREVESELSKAQIKITNERWPVKGRPHLVVSVLLGDPVEKNTKVFPFTVCVGFWQKVALQRQPDISVFTSTWLRIAVGSAAREIIFASIVETILFKVNEFNITLRKTKRN